MKYADMAQAQAAVLIAEMEKGHPFLPFLKPGDPALVNGLPYNPTTGRAYRGGNMVMLWIAGMVEGYEDRRWLTYRQAQSIGAQVRKGAVNLVDIRVLDHFVVGTTGYTSMAARGWV